MLIKDKANMGSIVLLKDTFSYYFIRNRFNEKSSAIHKHKLHNNLKARLEDQTELIFLPVSCVNS